MKKLLIISACAVALASAFLIGRHVTIMNAELVSCSDSGYSIAYNGEAHDYKYSCPEDNHAQRMAELQQFIDEMNTKISENQRFIDETQAWLDAH